MTDFRQDFLRFALEQKVLKFGEFTTKAGRPSPYFFNAGLFDDGASTLALARFYAQAIDESGIAFDMLFGPAYKGIILAAATAMMLAERGRNVPFAYNRKEAKDHGEGGTLVGAPLKGRVLIIDDVISAGTSVRESVKLIQAAGAEPAAVAIAHGKRHGRIVCRAGSPAAVRPAGGGDCQPAGFVCHAAKQRQCRNQPLFAAADRLPRALRRRLIFRLPGRRFRGQRQPETL